MKKLILLGKVYFSLLIIFLFFPSFQSNKNKSPMSISEIRNDINNRVNVTKKVFDWKDASDHLLYSALLQNDSIAVIGYRPNGLKNVRKTLKKNTNKSPQWQSAKTTVQNKILNYYQTKYGSTFTSKERVLFSASDDRLPYFYVKVFDAEIIEILRNDENVRYVEPTNFKLEDNQQLKNMEQKCGKGVHPRDKVYANQFCDYYSWSFLHHNIPQAWDASINKGQGVKVAVLDEGISQDFIDDFNKGESSGRTFEGHNELSGPDSDYLGSCNTHGTKVAAIIAGPKTHEGDAFGIAYRSDLKYYRVSSGPSFLNVVITADEIQPVANALMDAINSNVKVINMSIGTEDFIIVVSPIEDALSIINNDTEILVFAAAGSLSSSYPVVYPATSSFTKAVTGITVAGNTCSQCHDGSQVDFAAYIKNNDDRDIVAYGRQYVGLTSAATATISGIAALLWADNPTWTRQQVVDRLEFASKHPNGNHPDHGHGAVDAYKALTTVDAPPFAGSNESCKKPTVIFYEGNNATQDILCYEEFSGATLDLNFVDDENTCINDEARSMELFNFTENTFIRIYNDKNKDQDQAWYEMRIYEDISQRVIGTFEDHILENGLLAVYHQSSSGIIPDGLDGKVSRVEIYKNNSVIPIFVSNIDLEPNCTTMGVTQAGNTLNISNLQISNLGDAAANDFKVYYSLTDDNNSFDLGVQPFLGLDDFSTLTAPSLSFSTENVPTGNYYLKIYVETEDFATNPSTLSEYDLTNNTCYSNAQFAIINNNNAGNCSYTISNETDCEVQLYWFDGYSQSAGAIIQPNGYAIEQIENSDLWAAFRTSDNTPITPAYQTAYCSTPYADISASLCDNAICDFTISNNTDCEVLIRWTDNNGLFWDGTIIQPNSSATQQIVDGNFWAAYRTDNNAFITYFEPAYCSSNITIPSSACNATITCDYTFTNYSDCGLQIMWIDENGISSYGTFVPPNGAATQQAEQGMFWEIYSTESGALITPFLQVADCSYPNIGILESACISSACDPDGNFSGIHSGTVEYTASGYVHAPESGNQCIITFPGDVSLKAGNYIKLKPGFHAQYNSKFQASIEVCETPTPQGLVVDTNTPQNVSKDDKVNGSDSLELQTENLPSNMVNFNNALGGDKAFSVRNYPNPFNQYTTIEYTLPEDNSVSIAVYNAAGQQVILLQDNEDKTAGTHTVVFQGDAYPAGMYYYIIKAGEYADTQKMILVK